MLINFNSPLSVMTSYGITGLNVVEKLSELGHDVFSFPIGPVSVFNYQKNVIKTIEKPRVKECRTGKSVKLYHQHALFEHISDYHIGWPIFELDNFSDYEYDNLLFCDEIFVCSNWAADVIERKMLETHDYKKLSVIPLGVDTNIFHPEESLTNRPFTFFFPGKFEIRKGFDIVMEVFDKAFPTEDVRVTFLPQNLFINDNDDWAKSLLMSKLGQKGKVNIVSRLDSNTEVASLINGSDAVVSFSRAEGWNLPLLEGLACGKPVVATNYSGHTQFLTQENATLIDIPNMEEALDGVFFKGDGRWLSYTNSDIDNFVSALREVYKKGRQVNTAGIETAKNFSWTNTANKLVEALC